MVNLVTVTLWILQLFSHLRCVLYRKYLVLECVHLGLSYSCISVILFTTSPHVSFRCLWLIGRSEAEHFRESTSQLSPPLYSLDIKSPMGEDWYTGDYRGK